MRTFFLFFISFCAIAIVVLSVDPSNQSAGVATPPTKAPDAGNPPSTVETPTETTTNNTSPSVSPALFIAPVALLSMHF